MPHPEPSPQAHAFVPRLLCGLAVNNSQLPTAATLTAPGNGWRFTTHRQQLAEPGTKVPPDNSGAIQAPENLWDQAERDFS